MEKLTVTVRDAADAIGICRATLYKHINSGTVDTVLVGGRRPVKVDSLRRLTGTQAAA